MIDFFTRIFRREQPTALRCRRDQMCWIKGLDSGDGDRVLNGRAVKTITFEHGLWQIDPPQEFVVDTSCFYVDIGQVARRGEIQRVTHIADDCLDPWKDIGDVTDEKLFEAPPKAKEPAHA